jgi:peptidoglycan/xylan/chitin deacetylase (PgdA/CDA1 family)
MDQNTPEQDVTAHVEPAPVGPAAGSPRRTMLGLGVAGVAGMFAGSLAGAKAVAANPWLMVPTLRARNEIARWELRRHRPVSTEVRWCVETERRMLALTFDDGPDPEITPMVLDALGRHEARATFFVLGELAERYPDTVRAAHDGGHEIGNHTWSHPDLVGTGIEHTTTQIGVTSELLESLVGETPRWFRPPRGQVTGEAVGVAARQGLDIALWSQRFGASEAGAAPKVDALCDAVQPGDIILCHDGVGEAADRPGSENEVYKRATRTADAKGLEELLGRLRGDGWDLVTLSEMVESDPSV